MTLARKIVLSLLGSIFFIAFVNIVSFYFFYRLFLNAYLYDTVKMREEITRDYIDEIIEKQALDEVDNIFNDIELQFFELLDKGQGKISLDTKENIDIVVNYLSKAGVSLKYIEEMIPKNYITEILEDVKNEKTPEYIFFSRFIKAILLTNGVAITLLVLFLFLLSKQIIFPIEKTTSLIRNLKLGKDFQTINYSKKDEIGLLVHAINELNSKLNIGENIRNKLLADISHELKTPITAIQCYVEGIKDGVIQLNDTILDSIIQEMHRLVKLVNKIMEFQKFETQKLELHIKTENITQIVEQVLMQFQQKLTYTSQSVKIFGIQKHIPTDKDRFIQVVQNLISNFIKYAGNNTVLKIEITQDFIYFYDNGKGISPSELPYIKEKFYQGWNFKTGDVDDRGIGIGFSIIDKIVKELHWEMIISSDIDKGFQVKILFHENDTFRKKKQKIIS